jgi:DNA-binding response OmpR family regulator
MKIRLDWSRSLVIESHGLTMCRTKRWATFEGRGIALSPRETEVLWTLVVTGRRLSSDDLIDCLYGENANGGPDDAAGCISQFIHRLRHKLGLRVIRGTKYQGGFYFAGNLEHTYADTDWLDSTIDPFKYVPNRTQHEIATAD